MRSKSQRKVNAGALAPYILIQKEHYEDNSSP
jgi:hypothetical protein